MHRKKQPLSALKENQRIEDVFVVKMKKGLANYTGGYYFILILSDGSGSSMDYKYWGGPEEERMRAIYDSIKEDAVVLISGKVQRNRQTGRLEIASNPPIEFVRPLKDNEYDTDDFIAPPKRPLEEMAAELKFCVGSVTDHDLKKLLEYFFAEGSSIASRFLTHPGAIEIHHNWKGGLLQHTLEVVKYCELTKSLFSDLNRDILITGALLHDIGKLDEMTVTTRIKGTRHGQLHHHIPLGFAAVSKAMDALNTPQLLRDKILHIIVSHHGQLEYSSPKPPMFPEAIAVYYADEMSSKLADVTETRKKDAAGTEDEFMYSKRHERNMFLR
jgi:3'-5' exoribonuclease